MVSISSCLRHRLILLEYNFLSQPILMQHRWEVHRVRTLLHRLLRRDFSRDHCWYWKKFAVWKLERLRKGWSTKDASSPRISLGKLWVGEKSALRGGWAIERRNKRTYIGWGKQKGGSTKRKRCCISIQLGGIYGHDRASVVLRTPPSPHSFFPDLYKAMPLVSCG